MSDFNLIQKCIAEFIGTCVLITTIKVSVAYNDLGFAPIAIGFSLAVSIFSYGYISGAHFNPCVTVGVMIRDADYSARKMYERCMYIISQLIGGCFGGFLGWVIGGSVAGSVYPDCDKHNIRQCFVGELFYTYLLVTVVLQTATDKRSSNNSYFGLCIGSVVMIGAFTVGSISGGCFNTAVWVGTIVSAAIVDREDNNKDADYNVSFSKWYIYIFAPLLGGILAGLVYRLLYYSEAADQKIAVKIYEQEDNVDEVV